MLYSRATTKTINPHNEDITMVINKKSIHITYMFSFLESKELLMLKD